MPYILGGYNLGLFDLVSMGMGLGIGYALVQQTGDVDAHFILNGLNVTAELNLGLLF